MKSIEAPTYEGIDEAKAAAIIDDCASYFDRNPYRRFNVLDRILTEALGVSYFHKTACHLDLVQWATDPIWKELHRDQQERLLEGDRDFLRRQLTHEGYKVIIVNGATAMRGRKRRTSSLGERLIESRLRPQLVSQSAAERALSSLDGPAICRASPERCAMSRH